MSIAIPTTSSGKNLNFQAENATAVTKSDTTTYPPSALYVGGTGDVAVVTSGGDTCTFTNVPVGFFPVQITKVLSTGTTASGFVVLR